MKRKPNPEQRSVADVAVPMYTTPGTSFDQTSELSWDEYELVHGSEAMHRAYLASRGIGVPFDEEGERLRCRRLGEEYVPPAERERRRADRSESIWALSRELDQRQQMDDGTGVVESLRGQLEQAADLATRQVLRRRLADAESAVESFRAHSVELARQVADYRAEMKAAGLKETPTRQLDQQHRDAERAWALGRRRASFPTPQAWTAHQAEVMRLVRAVHAAKGGPAAVAIAADLAAAGWVILPDGRVVVKLAGD